MFNIAKILMNRKLYRKQAPNLLYPNDDYINNAKNVNKADLKRFQQVFDLNKHLSGRMLDLGCNDGFLMRKFDWKFDEYVGVDMFSIDKYTNGKFSRNKNAYTKNGKILYVQSLLESIDEQKLGKFDFIFAGEFIEHLKHTKRLFLTAKRLLRGGGVFVITTPNNVGGNLPEHYRQYSKESLSAEIAQYFDDFDIFELPAVNDSWPFLMARIVSK
ncbi:hypothetical protein FACS1894186_2700 [Alphaproteobacteria bacterium]|nr:hypothetical protein FACS1894186_2700 [Alphaproteobacteria bacterium]